MLMPSRPNGKARKRCTWHEGCSHKATQDSRFCVVHLNKTIHGMRRDRYKQPLAKAIKWLYKSTIRGVNWNNG